MLNFYSYVDIVVPPITVVVVGTVVRGNDVLKN